MFLLDGRLMTQAEISVIRRASDYSRPAPSNDDPTIARILRRLRVDTLPEAVALMHHNQLI